VDKKLSSFTAELWINIPNEVSHKSFCQTFFKKFGGIVKGATLDTGFLRAVALKLLKIQTKFA